MRYIRFVPADKLEDQRLSSDGTTHIQVLAVGFPPLISTRNSRSSN